MDPRGRQPQPNPSRPAPRPPTAGPARRPRRGGRRHRGPPAHRHQRHRPGRTLPRGSPADPGGFARHHRAGPRSRPAPARDRRAPPPRHRRVAPHHPQRRSRNAGPARPGSPNPANRRRVATTHRGHRAPLADPQVRRAGGRRRTHRPRSRPRRPAMRTPRPATLALLLLGTVLLAGCAGPSWENQAPPARRQIDRLARLARAAWNQGNLAQADTLFAQCLRQARALDEPEAVANAAYNLAAVRIARGRLPEARPLLDEAAHAARRAGQPAADIRLLQARLALAEGRWEEARRRLDALPGAALEPAEQLQATLLRGELACQTGALDEAERELQTARSTPAPIQGQPLLAAGVERLAGRLALAKGRAVEAAEAFDRETDLCRAAGAPAMVAEALGRAAEAWKQAGRPAAAADRACRAAHSHLAQGNLPAARRWLEQARTWAAEAQDPELDRRVSDLAAELSLEPPETTP
ncbi:MAG: tetratricopeptide repeat protein [Verrucomicrobia bacterium]|nr:MAG: tetratricopeptide repeat protein [Verrucomicrobiota bacterium]